MATILILGTIAADRVVRIAKPLRAGSHQEGEDRGIRLGGGAANTAVALARAGHRALPVSAVGDDPIGRRLIEELAAQGVDTGAIKILPGETSAAFIITDGKGERTIVNLKRVADPEPPERILGIEAAALYVRSRRKELAPLLAAKAASCPVIAHIPPLEAGSLPAHILVGSASDLDDEILADPLAAGRRVAGDLLRWMAITDGARGATLYGIAGEKIHCAAPQVKTVDTTGAGDAFAGGLIHGLLSSPNMDEAMDKVLKTAVAWGSAATTWESSIPGADFPPEIAD